MAMTQFHSRFPEIAEEETRGFIIPKGHKLLPPGQYGFVEYYCDDPECDCKRVIFQISEDQQAPKILATINFGWESLDFYERWLGSKEGAEDMVGATIEPFGPQSDLSPALLKLCVHAMSDQSYLDRIKRHYNLFRASVAKSRDA